MNKILLFLFFICAILTDNLFSQEVKTIKISKENTQLYQGLSEELSSWYFFLDSDSICYLAELKIPEEEIKNWFETRKNSNNIFKGKIEFGQYPTLMLTKDNDAETRMNFYVVFEGKNRLNLNSAEDGLVYEFIKK